MNQITIDIGNTRTKYAVFAGSKLIAADKLEKPKDLANIIAHYEIKKAIVSSVRHLDQELKQLSVLNRFIELTATTPIPVINKYGTPQTLGMDRLAAVVGACALYPNQNLLVIDAGTCITFDFIDRDQAYYGGSISPGLAMKFKAMHTFTGKLPLVEQTETDNISLIGRNTIECLQSGVFNGTVAEVDGLIVEYKKQFPDLKTLVCGGDAPFFEKNLKARIFAEPNLVLIGLNHILNYNV
ncbi:type III pantothenate kinase [Adhaeribacter pallidiroseus]|uniref:Type III pantothenate kinase n=1 Tax=Adhaeribacter pallidiroseus TaxID=2072847 RepID=A0A369QSU9_9BACT|nr:type III pantothenate kinase [Adhaeribacter pallidiroseus]RDC65899.1 Pantothenate kinase [Adhaeribacter pallidiroseus]